MRIAVVAAGICLALIGACFANGAKAASQRIQTHIPPEALGAALSQFAQTRDLQVLYFSAAVQNLHTQGAAGNLNADETLTRLLKGTGLTYRYVNADAITVLPIAAGAGGITSAGEGKKEGKTSSSAGFRVAQVGVDQAAEGSATVEAKSERPPEKQAFTLEEVLVTAQKRSEKLMEVPVSVTAISGERLEAQQVNSLADLANYVPGMSVISGGVPGARDIILRGLNTGSSNATVGATVGTYVDDLPIGLSGPTGRGAQYGVDLQPYDIDRVEVLKGPQGTLYGANTLGGLVKYVTRAPSLTQFEASTGTGLGYTEGAGSPNWDMHAYVNVPIVADTLAVRASAYKKGEAGYVDNIGIGVKDANSVAQEGARVGALWQATDSLAIRATVFGDRVDTANITAVTMNGMSQQPLYGPLVLSTKFPEPYRQTTLNGSLSIDWDLGFATLTSATGWSKIYWQRAEDYSVPYGSFCVPGVLGAGNPGCVDYPFANALALFQYRGDTSKVVEETRLTSLADQRVQWMVGGFYTREKGSENYNLPTFTPSGVELPAADNLLIGNNIGELTYKEAAGFGNVTFKLTDLLDVGGGIRYSRYAESTAHAGSTGVLYGNVPVAPPNTSLPYVGVTNWMIDIRFHPSKETMTYARVATGYRPGYGCKFHSDGTPCGVPSLGVAGIVNPDRTTNYEAGLKGQFFGERLQLDLAVFYIDWKDIQVQTLSPEGVSYAGNGGRASSRGVELATGYQMTRGLRVNATLAYTDAHLDEDAPGVNGKAGDALPDAPRVTGSLSADYVFAIASDMSLLMGGGYQYRDGIVNLFEHSGRPTPIGPESLANLYAGLTAKHLTMRLYGTNLLNNRSYAALQFISDPRKPRFVPVQPRTIGLAVDYQF